MLHETYTSCIKPDGIYEGKTIKASDVIELQRGGTGVMLCQAITYQLQKFLFAQPGPRQPQCRPCASRFVLAGCMVRLT